MEKDQVNYPVPGEKFKIIAHGKYICVMLKDHNLNSENVYKISVFNPKEKLNIFTAQYDHVKSIALQVMKYTVYFIYTIFIEMARSPVTLHDGDLFATDNKEGHC